jgi:ribonucleoside-triphosphate reductase (thioredoxin)
VSSTEIPWGPTGEVVYKRTYSRTKPNGEKETWPETVRRVAQGNLSLVYGDPETWSWEVNNEFDDLVSMMERFAILPAGRHLWASGVKGRQYLFNCHVSGFGKDRLSDHFDFTFLRLMEGGGVGANYSTKYLWDFDAPRRQLKVHVVCDPSHPDYADMEAAGVLSHEYSHEWEGAFPVEDSREGWAEALVDLIDTYMTDETVKHENRVYDVSRVRRKGAPLRTFGGTASGPQPFARMMLEVGSVLNSAINLPSLTPLHAMEIDHAIAECVVSGGVRRSARMSICHWQDPYIFYFINAKRDTGKHWTTNISVEVDDEFLDAWKDEEHPDHEHAVNVHEAVVKAMLENGEPGYWNSSLSNVGEIGGVIATNPCGEIALPEWGACVLGHVNLDAFSPTEAGGKIDFEGLTLAHELMTRFTIRATFGDMNDPKQKHIMDLERRVGVGHLGVQAFLVKSGVKYSEAARNGNVRLLLDAMSNHVRKVAREYAFDLRIPEPIKVTTVAPTGSIAKLPGVTEGIHPIYARYFLRRVRFTITDPAQADTVLQAQSAGFTVEQDIYDASGNTYVVVYPTMDKLVQEVVDLGLPEELVESADEISLRDMLAFQAMYQTHYADNAVSMTVNFVDGSLTADELAAGLMEYLPYIKGTTVMPDGAREQAPYERLTREQFLGYEATRVEDGTDEDCASGSCPVR